MVGWLVSVYVFLITIETMKRESWECEHKDELQSISKPCS